MQNIGIILRNGLEMALWMTTDKTLAETARVPVDGPVTSTMLFSGMPELGQIMG